ncbi:sodium/pantothenate symporter [Spelaeicoccus albus]|uniref:Sodium/pantothenate symporter n=1 Tax=Spelaeicoccus albus TaxID=1280376 RepID=A0A7Z0D1E2_9MICO|nr:sodium/pantothenate symporter [Spelaeicoccus albus]NYI66863.1 sodium/pantothenate symporter [Spelaeicoccus albus]
MNINYAQLIPIIVYLLLIAGIGIWAALDQKRSATGKKTENYYVGGRRLGPFVLIFTILASAASAGTFIGGPGLGYQSGLGWVLMGLFQTPTAFLTVGLLGKKYAILARKLHLYTYTDFFKERYNSKIVVGIAAAGIIIFLTAYMVAQYAGGSHILHSVTGVPYSTLVWIFAGIVALYTAFGGFMGASINDTAQGVIMFVGSIVLWFGVFAYLGTPTPMDHKFALNFPDLVTLPGGIDATPVNFLSYSVIFGLMIVAMPHTAVRAMSYRNSQTAHRAMVWSPVVMAVFSLGFAIMGVVARLVDSHLSNPDLAIPTLIEKSLSGPIGGALFAAPLAAIMSTVSSMLLIVSGAVVRDIYNNFINKNLADSRRAGLSMVVSLVIGFVVLLIALKPPPALELIVIFAISGLGATFFVPLLGGLYWPRGNRPGAISAMIGGLVWYIVGQQWVPALGLGFMPVVTAVVFAIILYVGVSLLTPPPPREVLVKFWGTNREIQKLELDRTP